MRDEEINQLRRNARALVRELGLLNDAYFNIGVTLAERHLLIELESCGKTTLGDIARRLLLDKTTISRLIAKALRKGYIRCDRGAGDRRQRWVELSERGREVLAAFESIAFRQTRDALLTLTPEEVEIVYRGVALYAQGLKRSRLAHADSS
jgi:DNA-binding MarR family transcriptional regulator